MGYGLSKKKDILSENLRQIIADKSKKLSSSGFGMERFPTGFSYIYSTNVKT